MKKILIVDFNGTSSVYTHYLAKGIQSDEVEVNILGQKKTEFLDIFEQTNKYLGFKFGIKLLDYILNWFWLLLNFKKFDGIIIQWLQLLKYISFEINLVSYLQSRIPLIYIVHNLYPHNSKSAKINYRYNLLYLTCMNLAVHTSEMAKSVRKISEKANILTVQHGLFFKEFRAQELKTESKKCLLIGYISKYKGAEDALKIVKKLKDKNVFVSLEIIGFGKPDYVSELIRMVDNYKISDRVTILSKIVTTKFLIKKINEAEMLWLPYKKISQSGVAYTSIGLGTPIVAYNVGNFNDAFGIKNIAEIVEKDDLKEFCFAVEKVLNNNETYKKAIRKRFSDDLWEMNKMSINNLF